MYKIVTISISDLKNEILDYLNAILGKPVKGHGELSKRIKHRHRIFWEQPDSEIVRNTIMNASDPIEKWKNVKNWQRKLSNKYNSREFAKMHGCRVPEIYWRGRDIEIIDFTKLPAQFVIRPTIGHSCQNVFLMNEGFDLMNGTNVPESDLKGKMLQAVSKAPYMEFLIEEFIKNERSEHKIPDDYKLFMFNGELAVIEVINRVKPKYGFETFYDENWNQITNLATDFPEAGYQEPPKCMDDIIRQAKKLSKAYEIFVRIDFYASDKGAVFGEFTPTPALGNYFTTKANKLLISYWDKYCHGMI